MSRPHYAGVTTRVLGFTALFALGAASPILAVGCGGDSGTKQVKAPTAKGDGGAPTTGQAGSTAGQNQGPDQHADVSSAAKAAYDRGWSAWMAGDLAGAKKAFTEAGAADPQAPAPHYSLGCVLERQGDLAGAQQEYRTAFSLKPDYTLAMGAYALSLANSGHGGEADTFLSDKHTRNPNSAPLATYLAQVKSIEKDSGSAQQLAQDALRLDPDYKDAMVTIARDHYRARRMELALYALQAILDGFGEATPPRDKDNAEAHLLRGLIERESGKRAAAMTDFEAAKAKRPDLVEATIQLGVMKLEAGNSAEATPLLETAVKYAPQSAIAHVNLGDAYRLGGRYTEAKREFETSLSLDSSLAVAHYDMGLLYLFSPSIPGFQPLDQVRAAQKELDAYKTMRGKPAPGTQDDVDDLLSRAKAKEAELKNPAPATPAAAPAASGGAAPAASGAAAGGDGGA
jgi:Tfp pilus assembly protein PilF